MLKVDYLYKSSRTLLKHRKTLLSFSSTVLKSNIVETMGMVFGKIDVAEPAYETLLSRTGCTTPYDIRQYGKRFAIETEYTPKGAKDEDQRSPFFALAGYIGAIGEPQNEGANPIAMTAPVVMETPVKGDKIAMTAPVVMSNKGDKIAMTAPVAMSGSTAGETKIKTMQFILPAEFDSLDKIPKPTNPKVKVKQVDPAVGVVHRFTGFFNDEINTVKAKNLAAQLKEDGLDISEETVLANYQFWGYNPPFTIPFMRRNEVWFELKQADAQELISKFGPKEEQATK